MIRAGLEACQLESDSEYLDTKSEVMMAEINQALAAFNAANHEFQSAKQVSKEKLTESRDRLEAATEEVQGLFQTLQNVCGAPRRNFLLLTCAYQEGKLDEMPVDEVKGELEQVENELEMNLATNRNVIDLYQQRQAQVCPPHHRVADTCSPLCQIEQLTRDVIEEEARAEKINSSIGTARVCFSESNQTPMPILKIS